MKQYLAERWQLLVVTALFVGAWYFYYLNCCGYNLIMDYCQDHYLFILTDFLSVVYVVLGYPVHMYMQLIEYLDPRPGFLIFESKLPFYALVVVFQVLAIVLAFQQITKPNKLRYPYMYTYACALYICFIFINTVDFVNIRGYE